MPTLAEDSEDLEQGEPDAEVSKYETKDGKPYADDFLNLNEDRVAQLRSVCNAMDQRDEWARMIEIIRCTLRRYFLIGQQHPTWNADAGQFQVGPSGGTLGDEDENGEEFFEEEFNIYRGYHDIFNAVFSQTAAPARMEPLHPNEGNDVKAAREAEKYLDVYQKYNPAKNAQMEVAKLMWTDGRIVAVTEYRTDEEACGVDQDGFALGAEFTAYKGVLESKCPIIGEFTDWPYIKISTERDVTVAKQRNPKIASKLEGNAKGQIPNNEIARMSRVAVEEGIAQVSSDTLAYLITEDRWWLRPDAFRHLPDEEQAFWVGGETENEDGTTEQVQGLFEKGCRAKFLGTVFAGAKEISMDAQIKVMHSNPGWGNARGSKSDGIVPVQMEFNDAMGMYSEMIHKCIPHTLLNIGPESLAAITEQFSRYGEFGAMQPENGLPLADNIFQEQQIDVPISFGQWITNLQGALPQQLANIQPAMFGGNMEDQKTAKAYQQARDMSLGVMAIVWVPYLPFAAGIRWQAAKLAAQRDEKISAVLDIKDGKTKSVTVDPSVLGAGGFLCSPVNDQNFPESHTDKANKWMALFQVVPTNPIAQLIFQEPDNLVALKDATGLDIVIKGAAARDKQLAEWELMKQNDGPIPDVMGAEQAQQEKQKQAEQLIGQVSPGQQAPPVPPEPVKDVSSVPTRLADDHIEEARTCVRILNDAKTLELLTGPHSEWVQDLELHLIEHLSKAQKGGIMIPPDLLGIIPPLPPPMPGAIPGAAAVAPPAPGAPGGKPHPPKSAAPPVAGPIPPPIPAPIPLGGSNVPVTT